MNGLELLACSLGAPQKTKVRIDSQKLAQDRKNDAGAIYDLQDAVFGARLEKNPYPLATTVVLNSHQQRVKPFLRPPRVIELCPSTRLGATQCSRVRGAAVTCYRSPSALRKTGTHSPCAEQTFGSRGRVLGMPWVYKAVHRASQNECPSIRSSPWFDRRILDWLGGHHVAAYSVS